MEPGKYNISNEEYHSSAGMSNSSLQYFVGSKKCPKKYYHKYILGNQDKPTREKEIGSALHVAVLEREKWKSIYKIIDQKTITPATRNKYAPFIPFPFQDARDVIGMKKTIDQWEHCAIILNFKEGEAEQSLYWIDEDTGILCKTRPDFINYQINAVFDLKTTQDASPAEFPKSIAKWRYYMQAAMMIDGIKAVLGIDVQVCNFVVEKEPPYCAQIYQIKDADIEQGRQEYKEALRCYKACLEKNEWRAYDDKILEVELPYWATNAYNPDRAGL